MLKIIFAVLVIIFIIAIMPWVINNITKLGLYELKKDLKKKNNKEKNEKLKKEMGVDKEAQRILKELKKDTYVSPDKLNRRIGKDEK